MQLGRQILFLFLILIYSLFHNNLLAQGDNCSNAIDLCSLVSPYSSTTTGNANDFSFCSMGSAEDMIFYIDLPDGVTLSIGQTANSYDSRHSLRRGGVCPGTTQIICKDDPDISTETYTNSTGSTERVYWIQAGWSSSDGPFTLAWTAVGACLPTTCNDPSVLTALNIGASSVDLGWTENGSATTWDIELGLAGFSPTGTPTANDVVSNPYTYAGLTAFTSYDYYVRADCGGLESNWVGPFNFSTVACNVQNPSALNATGITSSSADLGWTENGNATVWDIELGISGFSPTGTPTANNVAANAYTYTGLASNTSYEYYVRAVCGGNSAWIGPFGFVTPNYPSNYTSEITNGWARDVVEGTDGYYLFVGSANNEILVAKQTKSGSIVWKKTYGGTGNDKAYNVVNSGDGGYVILSETESTTLNVSGISGDYDLLITKLDINGNHVWSRAVGRSGSSNDDRGVYDAKLIRNPDGTYAVIANSYDSGEDMAFVHISSTGTLLAAKRLNTQTAFGYALAKATGTNNGWIAGGNMMVGSADDFFVVKLKEDYTEDWSIRWGDNTSSGEDIYAIVENGADDYTVFGRTSAEGTTPTNMYAMRFTKVGAGAYTILWEKAYGTIGSSYIKDAVVAADGNYIVTGYCSEGGAFVNTYLMKINAANGIIIWQTDKPDDGTGNRQGEGVIIDSDGNYVVAGLGGFDMLKFASDGSICDGVPGSATTDDLGTSIANVDLTEASVSNIFAVGNASRTLSETNPDFGTFLPGCNVEEVSLPVELVYFRGENKGVYNVLAWQTTVEINNDYFTLESSSNSLDWNIVGVQQGAGNSVEVLDYSMIDNNPHSPITYYRLKQTDFDEKYQYSNIIAIESEDKANHIVLHPNPAQGYFSFTYSGETGQHSIRMQVVNTLGEVVMERHFAKYAAQYTSTIDVSNLSNGVYQVLFNVGNVRTVKRLIKY